MLAIFDDGADRLGPKVIGCKGGLGVTADAAAAHFGGLGYLVVGMFLMTWFVSFVIYRAIG